MVPQTVAEELGVPYRWWEDPIVWVGVVAAMASSAFVFFAGRYVPYIDWAGHVGLASVLAHGAETGADAYLTRSLLPSPYLLYYVTTAGWAELGIAEVGAKLNIVIASGLLVIGAARLAEATGRDPRLALLAPLALFGASLGFGVSSYLFAMPWLFFALADFEWLLRSLRLEDELYEREFQFRSTFLAIEITLCFLGHGLVFIFASVLIGARLVVHLLPRFRSDPRAVFRVVGSTALVYTPAFLLALPSLFRRLDHTWVEPVPPGEPPGEHPFFVGLAEHLDTLPGDLLDRGGDGHEVTALLLAGVLLVFFVQWVRKPSLRRREVYTIGPAVYFAVMLLIFAFGPVRSSWPIAFWVLYNRAGSFALLLLILLPTCDLGGRRGGALAALALAPVLHNAAVNAEIVREYSAWAAPYERVRAAVPPRSRVLPISARDALEPYPVVGRTLGYYLLVDGVAYVPVRELPEEVPVHPIPDAPHPPLLNEHDYTPEAAAEAYDHVVLRGDRMVEATRGHPRFEELLDSGGWVLFRRKAAPTSTVTSTVVPGAPSPLPGPP